jgi:hypothetical protein
MDDNNARSLERGQVEQSSLHTSSEGVATGYLISYRRWAARHSSTCCSIPPLQDFQVSGTCFATNLLRRQMNCCQALQKQTHFSPRGREHEHDDASKNANTVKIDLSSFVRNSMASRVCVYQLQELGGGVLCISSTLVLPGAYSTAARLFPNPERDGEKSK